MSNHGTMHALFAYHVSIRLRQICRRSRLHETRLDRLKCGCEEAILHQIYLEAYALSRLVLGKRSGSPRLFFCFAVLPDLGENVLHDFRKQHLHLS
jgi:hypothetical protein